MQPDRGVKVKPQLVDNDGSLTMDMRRNAPLSMLAPAPHLVNDGKSNISANVPAEFNPRTSDTFAHLKPRWQ